MYGFGNYQQQDPIFLFFSKVHVWSGCSCMVGGVTPYSKIIVGDSDDWSK